jgi:hypothetical protein
MSIRSIADIPFRERDAFALLNLSPGLHADPEGGGPDLEYAGFGYARVGELWLAAHGDAEPRPVREVLLLGLHTPDDAEPHDGDLLLEFWPEGDPDAAGDGGDEPVVQVMLSRFLAAWLPRISRDERAVVLAVCNPHHTTLPRAPALGGVSMHYPLGDTTSWYEAPADRLAGPGVLELVADAWVVA